MRVTKIPTVERLVALLNFDFNTGTTETLKKARLKVYELDHSGWKSRGKQLQEEIRSDLIPLLSSEPTQEFSERAQRLKLWQKWKGQKWRDRRFQEMTGNLIAAKGGYYYGPQFYLERLLAKINRLNLRFRWYEESGRHEHVVYEPDPTKPFSKETGYPQPKPGTERKKPNPALRLLGPERKILALQGEKFIVARHFSNAESLRELLYGIIAESLENGTFARLRMCPECKKLFLAANLKRQFCKNRCKDNFHNKSRLECGYFSERRRKKRVEREQEQRRARRREDIQRFTRFLQKAGGKVQAGSEIGLFIKKKIPGGWKIVNGWLKERNGKSVDQIWNSLSNGVKELFRQYWN